MSTETTEAAGIFVAAMTAVRMSEPVIEGSDGRRHALLPPNFVLSEIVDPDRRPVCPKTSAIVDDAASLVTYVNRFQDHSTIIVADYDELIVTAFLDYHNANDAKEPLRAGMLRHKATLRLRSSEEFHRWSTVQGEMHDQMDFARFMEENANDITDPDSATFIEISRDLEAAQGSNFKAKSRTQTGDRSFSYETETVVRNDITVPTQFTLSIPLFEGEPVDDITAYFRFRPQASGLYLGFEWRRVEYVRRARFRELAFRIAEETGRPVTMGRLS